MFSKEKAEGRLLTMEESATEHARRAEDSRGMDGGGGYRLLQAVDVRWAPPYFAPLACQPGILSSSQTLGKEEGFWEAVPNSKSEERWQCQGFGSGARGRNWNWGLVSPWQSSSRSRICPLLALTGQALAQVFHTWARNHMRGNPTLFGPSPQLPAARSKQGLWRRQWVSRAQQQGGYFPGDGSGTGEGPAADRGPTPLQDPAHLWPRSHQKPVTSHPSAGNRHQGTVPSPQEPPQGCHVAEEAGEQTLGCSQSGLSSVSPPHPSYTRRPGCQPAGVSAHGAFQHPPVLEELHLSRNVLARFLGAAFSFLAGTVHHLNLSEKLTSVPVEAFVGLQIQVNQSANP